MSGQIGMTNRSLNELKAEHLYALLNSKGKGNRRSEIYKFLKVKCNNINIYL